MDGEYIYWRYCVEEIDLERKENGEALGRRKENFRFKYIELDISARPLSMK